MAVIVKLLKNCVSYRRPNFSAFEISRSTLLDRLQPFSVMSFESEKRKYLSMPLDEKRKVYKCKQDFSTIQDVQTWPAYFSANQSRLVAQMKEAKLDIEKREANPKLSEKVSIWRGNITALEIDAIVNAANKSLQGGGGVDGAIHSAAGESLLAECQTLGGCDTGDAKITGAYQLPAKYVIHTVGPRGEHPQALKSCYQTSLNVMKQHNLKSIAFPCVSTGIYGYPAEAAAKVAISTVRSFIEENPDSIDRVVFCVFLSSDVTIYENQMQLFFPCN